MLNGNFKKIKSKYILQKIFNYLETKGRLNLIKLNKNIKERLDIHFNDYKEYSGTFSSIEIEIKPANNKYGKFINIERENEKYFHIYFNNKKEEIRDNYINFDEKIDNIKIRIDYQIKSFENLFKDCKCIESLNFKKFKRNNINNMSCMFYECRSLKELNLSNFNTNNVVYINWMFYECSSLEELNLNNFNNNNIISMEGMFYGCTSLKELNLSNFNTSNVTDMSGMFRGCRSLKELHLNNFITDKVTNMKSMFFGCSKELILEIKNRYKNIREEAFEYYRF